MMVDEIQLIWTFLKSIIINWFVLLGGVLMTTFGLYERLRGKEIHLKLYLRILVGLLVVSVFLTWRSERIAAVAQGDPDVQKFDVADYEGRQELERTRKNLKEAQERLEQSERDLAETKAKTLKLESKLAPRELEDSEWLEIASKLTTYGGTKFQFVSYQDDAEVKGLVMQIIKMLLKAGWEGLPAEGFLMVSLYEGVAVQYAIPSEGELGPQARALAQELSSRGILAISEATKEMAERPDRIRIKVGKKPHE